MIPFNKKETIKELIKILKKDLEGLNLAELRFILSEKLNKK